MQKTTDVQLAVSSSGSSNMSVPSQKHHHGVHQRDHDEITGYAHVQIVC